MQTRTGHCSGLMGRPCSSRVGCSRHSRGRAWGRCCTPQRWLPAGAQAGRSQVRFTGWTLPQVFDDHKYASLGACHASCLHA